jgi:uncharacterized DUF497 family protein
MARMIHYRLPRIVSPPRKGYTKFIQLEWDKYIKQVTIEKHGMDFTEPHKFFESSILVNSDERKDYGEVRHVGWCAANAPLQNCIGSRDLIIMCWVPKTDIYFKGKDNVIR